MTTAIVAFERDAAIADRVADALRDDGRSVMVQTDGVESLEVAIDTADAIVAIMAAGIVVRTIGPALDGKWSDPAVVVVDRECEWAIPLVGAHHGGLPLARALAPIGATPVPTTATEATDRPSVEQRADALDAEIATPDATVATNVAILEDELGPVARIDGPRVVLVEDDVAVLRRGEGTLVLGTGCRAGVDAATVEAAWQDALDAVDRDFDAVEFVATGALKADETGLHEAAAAHDLGVAAFDRDTLDRFAGPSASAADRLGWPGIAEASAIAGGREHDLLADKRAYDGAVTVAIGR
ncbi:MAG: cobalt-precorrin 5A hydrolase [Halococcoides sp.]